MGAILHLFHKAVKVVSWFAIVLFLILAGFSYLLFAPFYLEINSAEGLYRIRFHRLFSARLMVADTSLKVEFKIAGWSRQIDVFTKTKQTKKRPPAKKKQPGISFKLIVAVIKSFKVNKCYVSIDTGSMQLNGILYPGFYFLSRYVGKTIEINFLNRNEIILEIKNNLARIIRVFIFHLFTHKKQKNGQFK